MSAMDRRPGIFYPAAPGYPGDCKVVFSFLRFLNVQFGLKTPDISLIIDILRPCSCHHIYTLVHFVSVLIVIAQVDRLKCRTFVLAVSVFPRLLSITVHCNRG